VSLRVFSTFKPSNPGRPLVANFIPALRVLKKNFWELPDGSENLSPNPPHKKMFSPGLAAPSQDGRGHGHSLDIGDNGGAPPQADVGGEEGRAWGRGSGGSGYAE